MYKFKIYNVFVLFPVTETWTISFRCTLWVRFYSELNEYGWNRAERKEELLKVWIELIHWIEMWYWGKKRCLTRTMFNRITAARKIENKFIERNKVKVTY